MPGASGLDDAVQVAVEVVDLPGSPYAGSRLYTYLRDELGTVVGVVAEGEGTDPEQPPLPVRYLYSPYGEAHAESAPELRRVRFDNEVSSVETSAGTVEQTVADPALAAGGALRISLSIPAAESSLAAGVVVERLEGGSGWVPVDGTEAVVARDAAEPGEVLVLLRNGWERGVSYRALLTPSLVDAAGRSFGDSENLEWSIPLPTPEIDEPPVIFERRFSVGYESYVAAGDTVGGRFPGGQTSLFQGLWTDPVTGVAHARARWYDARNATWLSEDPYDDFDSPNLYAFVGWQPNMATDPSGEITTDTALDVGMTVADAYKAYNEWSTTGEISAETRDDLEWDLIGLALPMVSAASLKAVVSGVDMASDIGRAVRRIEDGLDGLNDASRWGGQASRRIVEGADEVRDLRRLRLPDNAAGGLKYGDEVADARQARRLDNVADAGPTRCILAKCLGGDTSVLNGEGLGPIKEVKVGNRLITTEESYFGATAVDEATWKVVRIRMPGSENAGALDLELLRSPEWMAAMGAAIGQEIWLEVPESGVAGFGVVEAIEPCPGIEEGPGRVVLSTIRVRSEDVVQVWLKGLYEPLEATADHPVYSVTREAWMGAGELLAGEEIWALGDTALVLEVDSKPGTYSVFNLEVEGEHVFFVSDLRVLSHNVSSKCPTNVPRGAPNTTRHGITRRNPADWRATRDLWDEAGYGDILSPANRDAIALGRTPVVDAAWIRFFPEDAGLINERIPMHHIQGAPITVPLPATRHMDAHMPGGFRYNPGGPGSALPVYPAEIRR